MNKYYKKEVLIIGYGVTGKSIAKYLTKFKCNIFIWDDDLEKLKKTNFNIFDIKKINFQDIKAIFVSPGVKKEHFILKQGRKKDINIINDIELFWEIIKKEKRKNKLIAITGTNGKSTIALMIANALRTKPLANFGNPILDYYENIKNEYVIELSSFQLDYINNFRPNISVISNINKDHITHHSSFSKYVKAKMNIIKNQDANDLVVVNYDDKNLRKLFSQNKKGKSKLIYVSQKQILKKGISVTKNEVIDNYLTRRKYSYKPNSFLEIQHNKMNFAISFISLLILGKDPKYILKKLLNFKGLPHRIEWIGSIKNINFFNDSKATNVAATCSALNSFSKVILIAGGSNKGDDFKPLNSFSSVIFETFLYGETASEIAHTLRKKCKNNICNDLSEAVKKSFKKSIDSRKNYPILFSPACASFDHYTNYKKRGEHFKKLFNSILKEVA